MIKKIDFFSGILLVFFLNMSPWRRSEERDFSTQREDSMWAEIKNLGSWNQTTILDYYINKKKVLDELDLKFYNELEHKKAELKYKLQEQEYNIEYNIQEQEYNIESWKLANDKFLEISRIPLFFSFTAFYIGFMIVLYKQVQKIDERKKNN